MMSNTRKRYSLQLPDRTLQLGERTLLMGILNVTPDSFSDGGKYLDVDQAVERAVQMEREGADLIDVGGESTRPGSTRVSFAEELHRVVPVLERLRERIAIPISIDTYKSEVAARAMRLGASVINDVSGGRWDRRIYAVVRETSAAFVIMHMRGNPTTWKALAPRRAVVQSTRRELLELCERARNAGISRRRILIDPGIGFGKNPEENLKILGQLSQFADLGYPLLIGPSRKSFLQGMAGRLPGGRIMGTVVSVVAAVFNGAHIVRVHDVATMAQVVRVADAIREGKSTVQDEGR